MPIEFPYDEDRATHATRWLLKRHGRLDWLKLIKLIVISDVRHLLKYGRPIVGGRYFAMRHGPVQSEFYDDLKLDRIVGTRRANDHFVEFVEQPDEDCLSETDLEVLHEVEHEYGNRDAYRLSDLTHELESWRRHGVDGNASVPMSYGDFFSEDRPSALELLGLENAEQARALLELVEDGQEAERALR